MMRPLAISIMFILFGLIQSGSVMDKRDFADSRVKPIQQTQTRNELKEKDQHDAAKVFEEDDYPDLDPAPSSQTVDKSGPIEHGTPLIPFIPKYPPPPMKPST